MCGRVREDGLLDYQGCGCARLILRDYELLQCTVQHDRGGSSARTAADYCTACCCTHALRWPTTTVHASHPFSRRLATGLVEGSCSLTAQHDDDVCRGREAVIAVLINQSVYQSTPDYWLLGERGGRTTVLL